MVAYRIGLYKYKVKSVNSRSRCPYKGTFSNKKQLERALSKTKTKIFNFNWLARYTAELERKHYPSEKKEFERRKRRLKKLRRHKKMRRNKNKR